MSVFLMKYITIKVLLSFSLQKYISRTYLQMCYLNLFIQGSWFDLPKFAESAFVGSTKDMSDTRICCKYFASYGTTGFHDRCTAWLKDTGRSLYEVCGLTDDQLRPVAGFFTGFVDEFGKLANWSMDMILDIGSGLEDFMVEARAWLSELNTWDISRSFYNGTRSALMRAQYEQWECRHDLAWHEDGIYGLCFYTHLDDADEKVQDEEMVVDDEDKRTEDPEKLAWEIFIVVVRYIMAFVLAVVGIAVINEVMELMACK